MKKTGFNSQNNYNGNKSTYFKLANSWLSLFLILKSYIIHFMGVKIKKDSFFLKDFQHINLITTELIVNSYPLF